MRFLFQRAIRLAAVLLLLLAVPALALAAPAPPDPAVAAAREKLDANRSQLDGLEAALAVEGLRSSDLDDLRTRLDPIRKELLQRVEDLVPRLADAKTRLAAFGAKPSEGQPAEDSSVTADREAITALTADLDAAVKQGRSLLVRSDQVSDRISARRRAIFAGQLFERSYSVLDPMLWTSAAASVSVELRALHLLTMDWIAFAIQRQNGLVIAGVVLGTIGILALVTLLGRLVRRRFRTPAPPEGEVFSRLHAARETVKVGVLDMITAPLAVAVAIAFVNGFDVVPPRVQELVHGLFVAVCIQAVGHGIAKALLAPGESWRRLLPISDRTAALAFRHASGAIWALSIGAFLNVFHRVAFAPVSITVATYAVMALLIGGFVARLLIRVARETDVQADAAEAGTDGAQEPAQSAWAQWLRFIAWVVLAVLAGALAGGYVSFATFVASRIIIASIVGGVLYLFYVLIDTFFSEGLAPDTARARSLAKMLGLSQSGLELIAALISGLLKALLFVMALFLVAGAWGASTADMMDTVERAKFGIQVGSVTITLWTVMSAAILLIIGLLLARGLQKWLSTTVLPRTRLEPSLQSSISTIVGYVGVILAIMGSMGELGLNLENVALVAGALSVGIGFGLQSIVSNFVSGLILLAERPIRVGDTINVKGEEGYVRRISVRSTEIETFDRASVIVPNSDLITGMVKNFTHANTTGRVIVVVNVAFDCDPEEVRDILVGCACDHPQVLQTPPPRVFLSKLTDAGMVFELRCVVANVDYALTVRSDLHFSLISRFRKAGINLVSQPWAALSRAPADMVPPPPAPPEG